jgi:hypothetical protein
MSYTAAQIEPLALRLCHDLPGLHMEVARTWIGAESGANNNPLGMTASRGSNAAVGQWIGPNTYLIRYPTQMAGIVAAADHVRTSSYYAGIRASLIGTIKAQALAIIASPWNATNSPYYTKVFTNAGLLKGSVTTTRDDFQASLDVHQLHLQHIKNWAAFQASLTVHQLHLQHLMNTGG